MRKRATALTNFPPLLQPCEAFSLKLAEVKSVPLPSKQQVAGSNPSRDAREILFEKSYQVLTAGYPSRCPQKIF